MKRLMLLALFAVGCAENLDGDQTTPSKLTGDWAVMINGGVEPWCAGSMHLDIVSQPGAATTVAGAWSCTDFQGSKFGGPVTNGFRATNGTIVFNMENSPGDVQKFLGVIQGQAFSGHTGLYNGQVPLVATPQ